MPPQQTPAPTTTIATHPSYADALATTNYLYDRGIPAGHLSIVGAGLRQLEQPAPGALGRLTLAGAGNGAWLGALVGALIAFFATSPNSQLTVVGWSILYGVLFGTLRGFLQGLAHNRPGAHRWESIEASRYDVLCTTADASVALQLLPAAPEEKPAAADETWTAPEALPVPPATSPAFTYPAEPEPAAPPHAAATDPAVTDAVSTDPVADHAGADLTGTDAAPADASTGPDATDPAASAENQQNRRGNRPAPRQRSNKRKRNRKAA